MSDTHLERLDSHVIPDDAKHEVRAFIVAKNEMLRIPYFLQYYREKGVSRFFFVDNNSDDGSLDYLLQQPDCHVFLAEGSYAKTQSGLKWSAQLLDQYGTGHWSLTVDADEILIWPDSEGYSLPDLCKWLDHEGAQGVYTFMLDMYSKGTIKEIKYEQGQNFLQACPYFDGDYKILPRVRTAFWKGTPFPAYAAHGGPRMRLCYPDEVKANTSFKRYVRHCLRQVANTLSNKGIIKETPKALQAAPALYKIPLVKWQKGYRYLYSTHTMSPDIKLSEVTGVLLHFKFFSDFYEKVDYACTAKVHHGGGLEYKQYAQILQDNEGKSLFEYSGTAKNNGTTDLVNRTYMKSTTEFEQFKYKN